MLHPNLIMSGEEKTATKIDDISIFSLYKYIKDNNIIPINDVMVKCEAIERDRLLFYVKHLHLLLAKDIAENDTPDWILFKNFNEYATQHVKYFNLTEKLQKGVLTIINELKNNESNAQILSSVPHLLDNIEGACSLFLSNDLLFNYSTHYQTIMQQNDKCKFIKYPDNIIKCKKLLNTFNHETKKNENNSPSNNTLKKYFIYYIYYLTNKPIFSLPFHCLNIVHIILMFIDMNCTIKTRENTNTTYQEVLNKMTMTDIYVNMFGMKIKELLQNKYDYFSLYTVLCNPSIKYSKNDTEIDILHKLIVFLKKSKIQHQLKQIIPTFGLKDIEIILKSFSPDKIGQTLKKFVGTSKLPNNIAEVITWSLDEFNAGFQGALIFPNVLFAQYPKELLANQIINYIKLVEKLSSVKQLSAETLKNEITNTLIRAFEDIITTPIIDVMFFENLLKKYCTDQGTLHMVVNVLNSIGDNYTINELTTQESTND